MKAPRQWPWAVVVAALFCVPLFVGLGRTDLGNDEAIYSFAVDKILETGDWLTPRTSPRIDIAFLEKPPLKFWIVAAPIRAGLLPHDEFGLRFWDAVMGAAAFLYVLALGVRLAGPVCGLLGVLLLFVHTPLLFDHGLRSNNMEGPLVLAYCGGIFHYLSWAMARDDRRRARAHVWGFTAYVLLGFLTKFVAIVFLPMVVFVAALVVRDDRVRLWRERRSWIIAAMTAAAVSAPWFLFQWWQFGSDVWTIMLGAHVYQRFTAYLDPTHLQPWHFYFSALYEELRTARSLALIVPGVLLFTWVTLRDRKREHVTVFLWFALPMVAISFGSSKLYHYIYPFLPPLALAGGYFGQRLIDVTPGWLEPHVARADARTAALLGTRAATPLRTAVRWALLTFALGAIGVGIVTLARGGFHLKLGDTTILRNASSVRPLLYALVFVALAASLRSASYVAAPILVLWLSPMQPYIATLAQVRVENHPLRTVRDCLLKVKSGDPALAGVSFYVDAPEERLHHFHHYYFEQVGAWEYAETPSDATLFARLHVPGKQKPVLVWEPRYQQFMMRLQGRDPAMFDAIARVESVPRGAVEQTASHASLPMVVLRHELLVVLPGQFGSCGS